MIELEEANKKAKIVEETKRAKAAANQWNAENKNNR